MAAFAQTEENSSQQVTVDPYVLCTKFPYNSVCKPYHLNPVALDDRPGEEVLGCLLKVEGTEIKGPCKYSIASGNFVVYIEEDQELDSLGGEKPTRIVSVSANSIAKLLYEEDTIKNRPSLLNIIAPAPVRIARQVFKKPKEVSLISVIFPMRLTNTGQSLSYSEVSATQQVSPSSSGGGNATHQQPQPVIVTLVVEREVGGTVRSQLESATGLLSEAPPAER
ncbi:hypothetical protein [Moorena sp. SIO3B2]|uniref:hypothetical protein n=1 Tax=Moorena sp. SIO3B2 TaxID=2607827 RepID=UPI0013CA9928|nr:hypothetical protein [Moorena sp. SIO3B2]NEP36266.1 hypothetical protein [Moorena sp. SIO3B2]